MNLIERLQFAFPFSSREIELLIHTAPRRYKVHSIEKRNGRGTRLIAQPTSELKLVQRWVVSNYIARLPVHAAAMAYRHGVGIRQHAQLHASNNYLLKLDFTDFFPSISGSDFISHAEKFLPEVESTDRESLMRLLFRRPPGTREFVLSIGAPSSPALSNTIVYDFDNAVGNYCLGQGVVYSRYADDLAFSTSKPRVLEQVKVFVENHCENLKYPRLKLNQDKTVFTSKKFQRQLTGLVLSNDGTVSVGRDRKREIRSMAHHFVVGKISEEQVNKLRGLIAFLMSIDSDYILSLKKMMGDEKFHELMKVG